MKNAVAASWNAYYVAIVFDKEVSSFLSEWVSYTTMEADLISKSSWLTTSVEERVRTKYQYAWFYCIDRNTLTESLNRDCNIDLSEINGLLTDGSKIESLSALNTNKAAYTVTGTATIIPSKFDKCEMFATDSDGFGSIYCYAYPLYVGWGETGSTETAIKINYYDQNSAEFNGALTSGYATKHINGTKTSLDTPTREGYKFDGWYLNDQSCTNESARVTELSADKTYETINLYAKWTAIITLTLTCSNFDSQRYMIYIYSGETLKMQILPTKKTETVILTAVDDYTVTPYKVCFVFGYLGNITFESLTNATYSGRNTTITTFANAAITYTIATPQINSSIMI